MSVSDFGGSPHPYGVCPRGNIYLDEEGGTRNKTRHEQLQALLSDEVWQKVLTFCDGPSLGNVVQTCREFYVAGHQPELWRDLVLRDVNNEGGDLTHVGPTWKDTYVMLFANQTDEFASHTPMAIPGIYSDFYFRIHLCRSFGLPSSWFHATSGEKYEVPRVSDISISEFLLKYEQPNQPVVLAGVAKSWGAIKKWGNPDYLHECTKLQTFRATSGAAPFPANFTVRSYMQYCRTRDLEEAPLYLFDRAALMEGPLREDYYSDLKRTCSYFDPDESATNGGHDLFQYLGEGRRPDHTWLIVGPRRSGSAFHMDPNATHAWNAAIVGRKRWIFYPPGVVPPGIHPSPSGDEVALPISLGEWICNYWEEHRKKRRSCGALECTVMPGDVVFVPHGWWHMVINLDDINIAITHNYVSKSNLPTVLRFLERKQDQISGCRDRSESIKPENLYGAFTKVLHEKHPDWLEEAKEAANQGWSCKAWSDTTNDGNENASNQVTANTLNRRKRPRDVRSQNEVEKPKSIMSRAKIDPPKQKSPSGVSTGFSFSFL